MDKNFSLVWTSSDVPGFFTWIKLGRVWGWPLTSIQSRG